jgi:hypothetical protein
MALKGEAYMKQIHKFAFGLLIAGFLAPAAFAGPPLICHALVIGQAKSLPWVGEGWRLAANNDYDTSHLVDDTLSILGPRTPVIVRMETLRRATLYAQRDPMAAKRLLFTLRRRAQDSDAAGTPDALAWFDFGYLVEGYRETRWMPGSQGQSGGVSELVTNFDGYSAVEKAISLRGRAEDAPQLEFAAALIALDGNKPGLHAHAQHAIDAAQKGDCALADNLFKVPFLGKQDLATALK